MKGQLTLANVNDYTNPDTTAIRFVNNGIMEFFSSAHSTKIEAFDNDVEITTTIICLSRYSDDKLAGHSMVFTKDIYDSANEKQFQ